MRRRKIFFMRRTILDRNRLLCALAHFWHRFDFLLEIKQNVDMKNSNKRVFTEEGILKKSELFGWNEIAVLEMRGR